MAPIQIHNNNSADTVSKAIQVCPLKLYSALQQCHLIDVPINLRKEMLH